MYSVNMSAEPSQRPYHHGNLRSALLTQARILLDQDGAEAVSFRAVARAAEVSQTAPYNHFANRRDLLAALAAEGFDELAASQRAALAAPAGSARFVALGRAYLDFAERQPQLYRLMFGTGVRHWHDDASVAAAKHAAIQPLRTAIAEHLAARGDSTSSEVAAITAWSVVHGLAMLLIDRSLDGTGDGTTGSDLAAASVRWFVAQTLSTSTPAASTPATSR
jgi:AcrR family transcriptional regulator